MCDKMFGNRKEVQKYVEIRKIRGKTLRKGSPKYECEYVSKVKNEISLNVDEQQDAIIHLKEYCDIDDIYSQRKDKAVCKTYNQPFA